MLISKELLINSISGFNLSLSDNQIQKLDEFAKLLVEYNEKVNLTAITEADEIVIKHFSDSLAPLAYGNIAKDASLIDVGTGAGFPAIVLMIAREDLNVLMLDSTKKKLDFIDMAIDRLSLNGKTLHMRAEEAGQNKKYRESFDIVTSRAVASLPVLSELCAPFLKLGGSFISLKGDIQKDEYEKGKAALKALGMNEIRQEAYNLYSKDKRSLVISKKISQTSTIYPRSFSQITKKPL